MKLYQTHAIIVALLWSMSAQATDFGMFMRSEENTAFDIMRQTVRNGDLSPIATLVQQRDLFQLWGLWNETRSRPEAHAAIETALTNIPGHAQYLADIVEKLTMEGDMYPDAFKPYKGEIDPWARFYFLQMLGELASPEAIQQLGRFLYDERNPGIRSHPLGMGEQRSYNKSSAVMAFNNALKEMSPLYGKVGKAQYNHTDQYPYYKQQLLEWWASDSSLPFRQKLPGVDLPEIVRQPPKLPHVDYPVPVLPHEQKISSSSTGRLPAMGPVALRALELQFKLPAGSLGDGPDYLRKLEVLLKLPPGSMKEDGPDIRERAAPAPPPKPALPPPTPATVAPPPASPETKPAVKTQTDWGKHAGLVILLAAIAFAIWIALGARKSRRTSS